MNIAIKYWTISLFKNKAKLKPTLLTKIMIIYVGISVYRHSTTSSTGLIQPCKYKAWRQIYDKFDDTTITHHAVGLSNYHHAVIIIHGKNTQWLRVIGLKIFHVEFNSLLMADVQVVSNNCLLLVVTASHSTNSFVILFAERLCSYMSASVFVILGLWLLFPHHLPCSQALLHLPCNCNQVNYN